jgi:hypothetical protein
MVGGNGAVVEDRREHCTARVSGTSPQTSEVLLVRLARLIIYTIDDPTLADNQ